MLSQKLVFDKSKNFTSDNQILMPPTVPLNHYTHLANQVEMGVISIIPC